MSFLLYIVLLIVKVSFQNQTIFTFDIAYTESLDPRDAYEHVQVVSVLSGLANREDTNFYVNYIQTDGFWLEYLRKEWLKNRNITKLGSLDDVLSIFRSYFPEGVVLYDPNCPSSSLIANTIAGVENLLPICYRNEKNSLYVKYVLNGMKLPVKINLVNMFNGSVTGSAKNDAYRWLIESYIKTKKVNPLQTGYFIDYFWTKVSAKPYNMFTVSNIDYVVAHKGVFFDLFFWDDETPNDDPNQPLGTDLATVKLLFRALYDATEGKEVIQVNGFTPWRFKYITGKHDGVQSEWETVKILTSYNTILDADACCIGSMTNAAFYQHYPLEDRYIQNVAPHRESFLEKGYMNENGEITPKMYISYYFGDFDSSAWLYSQLIQRWNDGNRGKVPLGWAINPNLSKRFPVIFPLLYSQLSVNDYITTGDSGAGYVNPTEIFEPRYSGLTDASKLYSDTFSNYYNQFNLKFTGFIINGRSGKLTDKAEKFYERFSYDGGTLQSGYQPERKPPVHLQDNTPFFFEIDISGNPKDVANTINSMRKSGEVQFFVFRGVLQTPSWFKEVTDNLGPEIEVVMPNALSYLARPNMGGNNNNRITFYSDNIPREVSGKIYNVDVMLRNEGWNILKKNEGEIIVKMKTHLYKLTCGEDVQPGETKSFTGSIDFGRFSKGEYLLTYQYYHKGGSFEKFGNLEWKKKIVVQ